jgi:hypothetical protein
MLLAMTTPLLAAQVVTARSEATQTDEDNLAETEVRRLNAEEGQAFLNKDPKALERLWADDLGGDQSLEQAHDQTAGSRDGRVRLPGDHVFRSANVPNCEAYPSWDDSSQDPPACHQLLFGETLHEKFIPPLIRRAIGAQSIRLNQRDIKRHLVCFVTARQPPFAAVFETSRHGLREEEARRQSRLNNQRLTSLGYWGVICGFPSKRRRAGPPLRRY